MASLNKIMLLGNLTRDPEVRYTPKGTAVAEIGMAINRIRTGENGDKIEEVIFVDVTLWGRQAELAGQYLAKGRPVFIEGRLQLDQWDDKQTGEKRSRLKVVGDNMQFLPSGGQSQGDDSSSRTSSNDRSSSQSNPSQAAPADSFDNDSDDIPF